MRAPIIALGLLSVLFLIANIAQSIALASAYASLRQAHARERQVIREWEQTLDTVKEWKRAFKSMGAANNKNEALVWSLLQTSSKP